MLKQFACFNNLCYIYNSLDAAKVLARNIFPLMTLAIPQYIPLFFFDGQERERMPTLCRRSCDPLTLASPCC